MNNNLIQIITFFLIFLTFFSCKNSEKNKNQMQDEVRMVKEIEKPKGIKFKISFPDTVTVGVSYSGKLFYSSDLDTIVTHFGDRENSRYARFMMHTTNNINYTEEYLNKNVKDTFGAIRNGEIPFHNINFKNEGVHYIDGFINELVLMDTMSKYNNRRDKARLIQKRERVTKKIIVKK
ncbi:hypothetical protein ACFSQ0_10370 [Mesonia sediminis]|uniref:Lipoprotein n=1 Tax=Mesonia sediminis TaxID=1703946 RepID=A0ABW5SGV9_9FLAO